jgi:hypothetical protein
MRIYETEIGDLDVTASPEGIGFDTSFGEYSHAVLPPEEVAKLLASMLSWLGLQPGGLALWESARITEGFRLLGELADKYHREKRSCGNRACPECNRAGYYGPG